MNIKPKKVLAAAAVLSAAAAATPAQAGDGQFQLLVLAMPTKYHYEYIPIARDSFEKLAKLHAFDLTWTAQPGAFEGDLSKYAAVVLLNSSGDWGLLTLWQRVALRPERPQARQQTASWVSTQRGSATQHAAFLASTLRAGPPQGATRCCSPGPHTSAGGALRLDWPLAAGLRDPLP